MKLEILLRLCNRAENNPDMKRIVDVTRDELILRCLNSMITSINEYVLCHHYSDINFTVVVDIDKKFQNKIYELFSNCRCNFYVVNKELDNNESMKFCYQYAKEQFTEDNTMIYFAEDDYLYFPNCFNEMLAAYKLFQRNLGNLCWVVIHPADSPLEYFPEALQSPYSVSRIVLGTCRHWRTSVSSPFTMLVPREAFIKHYDKFMDYAKFDGVNYHEANTINKMFIDDVKLFTPIPTLAFHLGYIDPPAPFCDHGELWADNRII